MKVNIIAPKDGWILQKVANELKSRLDYITITNKHKRSKRINDFDINYYIPYSAMRTNSDKIDMALFTHIEEFKESKANRFFEVANNANFCVTMSKKYELILRDRGVSCIKTINLGIDLNLFVPKLIIGFVGRLYKSERKGDLILSQIKNLDFIELRSTNGELQDIELPNFYRQLDYVLISSKYEGGPMCLVESLACGVPVISPIDIGQVSDFKSHIYHYENSNFKSLSLLLTKLYEKKKEIRSQVEHLSWDFCAEEHDKLFNKIIKEKI